MRGQQRSFHHRRCNSHNLITDTNVLDALSNFQNDSCTLATKRWTAARLDARIDPKRLQYIDEVQAGGHDLNGNLTTARAFAAYFLTIDRVQISRLSNCHAVVRIFRANGSGLA